MSRFAIGIFGHDGSLPHSACFLDVAKAMGVALRLLGHEMYTDANPNGSIFDAARDPSYRMIWFGANNPALDKRAATEAKYRLPESAIIYNSEQIGAVDDPDRYINNHVAFRDHVVWDYSQTNIKTLQQLGIERAVHCPIGYIATMTTIKPVEEDIDVLFYGSKNPHREKIFNALSDAGLKFKWLFGVYGDERDAWIARSKVVLNMHHYERGVFEIFRVSHLVANHKCVVSEDGGVDELLNRQARRLTCSVPYDRIVEACVRLARDPVARAAVADRAFRAFSESKFTDHVARALEQS